VPGQIEQFAAHLLGGQAEEVVASMKRLAENSVALSRPSHSHLWGRRRYEAG
jgi:hypothetical protein